MTFALSRRMRGQPLFGAAIAILSLLVSSCGSASDDSGENQQPSEQSAMLPEGTHLVEIRNFEFIPKTLTVAPGDTIIWRNLDVVPHTATSESDDWDSGNIGKNAEWTLVADNLGEMAYICAYHPSMTGTIIVAAK